VMTRGGMSRRCWTIQYWRWDGAKDGRLPAGPTPFTPLTTPTGLCLLSPTCGSRLAGRFPLDWHAGPTHLPTCEPRRKGPGPTRRARVCSVGPRLQRPISSFEAARRQQDDERGRTVPSVYPLCMSPHSFH